MGLFDVFSAESGEAAAARAKDASIGATRKGLQQSRGYIDDATGKATGYLSDALAPFEDIYGQEQQGREAYMNALGLGGEAGSLGARNMFMEAPGYQYELEQGSQNLLRNNAAAGGLRSGQTATDLQAFGQNQANKGWNSWLDRLQGFDPSATAQSRAGVLTNLGKLYEGTGINQANLTTSAFDKFGDARSQYEEDVYGAKQGALGNQWGAINSGLNLGAKLIGMV